jgi:hypothetical protein
MFLLRQNTKVELADGKLIPIGDVKIGHKLKALSGHNIVRGVRHVLTSLPLWEVNENLIGISSDQLLYTTKGWMAVSVMLARKSYPDLDILPLDLGDALKTDEGTIICDYIKEIPLYDDVICVELEVSGDNTFIVNGHFVHNKGGSSAPSSTTTVTKTDPPAYLQPYLTDIAENAQNAYRQVPQGGFQGQLVATPVEAQMQSIQQQKDLAGSLSGVGQPTLQLADTLTDKVQSGSYTAGADKTFNSTNLATTDAVNSYLQPVLQNLQEKVIPGVQSEAINSGAYGGSRYFTEMGTQINDNFTTQANNIAAQLGYGEGVRQDANALEVFKTNQGLLADLQKNEITAALGQPSLVSAGIQNELVPSTLLSSAGTQEQLAAQDLLDQAYQQYLLDINAPFAGLDQYASLIGGIPGGTATATGTMPKSAGARNPLAGAIGGGLGAYGLGTALGFSSLAGPPGIIGGAILGGLLG